MPAPRPQSCPVPHPRPDVRTGTQAWWGGRALLWPCGLAGQQPLLLSVLRLQVWGHTSPSLLPKTPKEGRRPVTGHTLLGRLRREPGSKVQEQAGWGAVTGLGGGIGRVPAVSRKCLEQQLPPRPSGRSLPLAH